jgi:hypothetical protein
MDRYTTSNFTLFKKDKEGEWILHSSLEAGIQKIKEEKERAFKDFVESNGEDLDMMTRAYHNALVFALKALGRLDG